MEVARLVPSGHNNCAEKTSESWLFSFVLPSFFA